MQLVETGPLDLRHHCTTMHHPMRILKRNFRILMLFRHHCPDAGGIEIALRYTSFASATGGPG